MGMTNKNFVYAENSGIIFCPDDVLYIKKYSSKVWDDLKAEFIDNSIIVFNDANVRSVEFNSKYFDDIKELLIKNSTTNKETHCKYDTNKK